MIFIVTDILLIVNLILWLVYPFYFRLMAAVMERQLEEKAPHQHGDNTAYNPNVWSKEVRNIFKCDTLI